VFGLENYAVLRR